MQITISVVKGSEEDKFNVKFSTSRGGGQERIKDVSYDGIAEKLVEILEEANEDGYIGKK